MRTDNTKIASELRNYEFINDSRPGYYLQINNQNCHYDIRVNDLSAGIYFDPYPSYSVRIPINLNILESGTQTLSAKVLPFKGEALSERASLQLRLMRYPDLTDTENDFGGSTVLWEWEMPKIEEELPLFAMDTVFEAQVPYDLNILDKYAVDLSKKDKDKLMEEVLALFEQRHEGLNNNEHDEDFMNKSLQRFHVQTYFTQEKINRLSKRPKPNPQEVLQPLENYALQLFGQGRIATLLSRNDYESAIWWADKDTGEAIGWQPFFVFKNKNTGQWHVW